MGSLNGPVAAEQAGFLSDNRRSCKTGFSKVLKRDCYLHRPLDDTGWNDNFRAGLLSYLLKTCGFPGVPGNPG
jgi:hypothetical protein